MGVKIPWWPLHRRALMSYGELGREWRRQEYVTAHQVALEVVERVTKKPMPDTYAMVIMEAWRTRDYGQSKLMPWQTGLHIVRSAIKSLKASPLHVGKHVYNRRTSLRVIWN